MKRLIFWSIACGITYVAEILFSVKIGKFLGENLGSAIADYTMKK